jgi:hypothetical protein
MLNDLLTKILWFIIKARDYLKSNGRRTRWGEENPQQTFFVIGFQLESEGIMSLVGHSLGPIVYAAQRGYIPVIDQQNYPNQYLSATLLHQENAWEYFFEQPGGHTLKDIARSKNIIICRGKYFRSLFKKDLADLAVQRQYYKKYIRFNEPTRQYIKEDCANVFQPGRKILGVLCRGTDYLAGKGFYTPVQPDTLSVVEKARQVMQERNCTHLYLATEDEAIYDLFKEHFGQQLLVNRQKRFRRDAADWAKGQRIFDVPMDIEQKKHLTLDYLSSLSVLAKCSCFVGVPCTGASSVYCLTDGFEYDYVYDLGRYPPNLKILWKKHWSNSCRKIKNKLRGV